MPETVQPDRAMKILFAAVLLVLAPLVSARPDLPAKLDGPLELTDHHGQPWTLSSSRGQVVILSFGYTSCPDVCPLTLGVVSAVLRDLGP